MAPVMFRRVSALIAVVFGCMLTPRCLATENNASPKPSPIDTQSIEGLRQQLLNVLKETHTPGLSVAIVRRDGPEWVAGLGLADVANKRPATSDTLFRIGSVSKGFVALAVLQLVNDGKLSLNDPVRKLAPEVWFENRWEDTDPVRVVNLLEHTTGWDDMHFREFAKDAPNMSLRDEFDFDHHSRVSRWRPGTRMAYSNSGPDVAAYIVEKITGRRFEDYVQQHLFTPIGMKTATYFQPDAAMATVVYHRDGKTPYSYWNLLGRPHGAINASAKDMAAYLAFYLNRGTVSGKQVVPGASIDRMEVPASTWAAKDGLKWGYGLANLYRVRDGFVYHGHDGGVDGDFTELWYLPDYSVRYFFSINSRNVGAVDQIDGILRAYITRNLTRPAVPPAAPVATDATTYAGWYEPDSPRMEMQRCSDYLGNGAPMRVYFQDGKMLLRSSFAWNEYFIPRFGGTTTCVPVTATQFRWVPEKGFPPPIASVVLISQNSDGKFIQLGGQTLKCAPTWLAFLQITLGLFSYLSVVSTLLYAPFWILGGLILRRRHPAERSMRIWPLLAVLCMIAIVIFLNATGDDARTRLGNLTIWSFSLFLLTLFFGTASVAGIIAWWRAPRHETRLGVRIYSLIVSLTLLITTIYLAYWGIIGLRTWA
jgi:CubicO group peptidase (beta-lactamase class C family)